MQGGDVAPSLGVPHLHQTILAAAGQHSLGGVPVTPLHVPPMPRHGDLGLAGGEVPNLYCTSHDKAIRVLDTADVLIPVRSEMTVLISYSVEHSRSYCSFHNVYLAATQGTSALKFCEAWYKAQHPCCTCVMLLAESVLALMVESSEQVANLRSEGLKAMPRTASLCAGSACSNASKSCMPGMNVKCGWSMSNTRCFTTAVCRLGGNGRCSMHSLAPLRHMVSKLG